jgi:hypothetical protein
VGHLIVACFTEADRIGGLVARMRLASLSQITSAEAATVEDRPELVRFAERALEDLRSEYAKGGPQSATGIVKPPPGDMRSQGLRRQLASCADLLAQRGLFLANSRDTMRRVTEASSTTLNVRRVSVWLCDERKTKISCIDLFDRLGSKHTAGAELLAKDFPAYFRALHYERTIAANDAHIDPRTSCFTESYLQPLGIGSLLDVPIWVRRQMVGVICHEHVGPKRNWDSDEETYAYLLSNFVALALEREQEAQEGPRSIQPRTLPR